MVTQFRAGIVSPIHALTICFEQTDRGAKHLRVYICEVKLQKPTDELFMDDPKNAKSQHAAQRRQPKNATLCSRRALDKQPAGSFPNFTTFELRAVLVVKPTVGSITWPSLRS